VLGLYAFLQSSRNGRLGVRCLGWLLCACKPARPASINTHQLNRNLLASLYICPCRTAPFESASGLRQEASTGFAAARRPYLDKCRRMILRLLPATKTMVSKGP
jgi:hypothetical protein